MYIIYVVVTVIITTFITAIVIITTTTPSSSSSSSSSVQKPHHAASKSADHATLRQIVSFRKVPVSSFHLLAGLSRGLFLQYSLRQVIRAVCRWTCLHTFGINVFILANIQRKALILADVLSNGSDIRLHSFYGSCELFLLSASRADFF